jgi:dynein heavy chain, axonemal
LFIEKKEVWQHLVPLSDTDSTELVKEFFACIAALMSAQLRSMVVNSLADFLSFFQLHAVSSIRPLL